MVFCFWFFLFKQKTAYEMRISDWSSDVCSSDLMGVGTLGGGNLTVAAGGDAGVHADWSLDATGYADTNRAGVASTGLNLAVASTGRVLSVDRNSGVVVGGSLVQTGGGDMDIRLGGKLNAGASKLDRKSTRLNSSH